MFELQNKLFASYKRRNTLFPLMKQCSIKIGVVISMGDELLFSDVHEIR